MVKLPILHIPARNGDRKPIQLRMPPWILRLSSTAVDQSVSGKAGKMGNGDKLQHVVGVFVWRVAVFFLQRDH